MTFLPSLPDDAKLVDVMRSFPESAPALFDYHEALLRGPSPLSVGQRELIAALVSSLNACAYCHGVHSAAALEFGVDEATLEAITEDIDSAPVDDAMRPLLRYVRKLTETPSRMTQGDAEAVYAAGWDERALFDAVSICGLFNLMNRIVDGLGISGDQQWFGFSGRRLADIGYAGLKDLL